MLRNSDKNLSQDNLLRLFEAAPVGLLYFDSEWSITFINNNFFNFGLLDQEDGNRIFGQNILLSPVAETLDLKTELNELKDGIFFEKEISSSKTTDGGKISLIVKGVSLFEEDKFQGGILILEDVKVLSVAKSDLLFSKPLFDRLLKEFTDIFFITDTELKIKYYFSSETFSGLLKSQDLHRKDLNDTLLTLFDFDFSLHPFDLAQNKTTIEKTVQVCKEEQQFTFQIKLIPFAPENGKVKFLVISLKEVSSSSGEEAGSKSEISELKQYQFITSAVTDAVIATDMQGNINFWNKSAESLFQYSRSQVFGKFIGKVIKDFGKKYFESIKQEVENKTIWESDLKIINGIGSEEHISLKISFSGVNEYRSIVFLCSSITERTRVEKELRISEERFRNIVINANEFICNLDLSGYITYVNPSFVRAFEYTEGELLEKNLKYLLDNEYSQQESFDLSEFARFNSSAIEIACKNKSGKTIFLLANFSPIFNFDGTIRYFNGIFTDITEKKKAEKELLTVRSVYEASRDGISVEVNRKFILVNDSFAKMFGYTKPANLLGHDTLDVVADEDIPKVARYIKAREAREPVPNRYDFVGKTKDGSKFYVEASVTSYEADNKIYTVRICRDITERKRAQEAIKDSEEKYRSITENLDDFLWTAEIVNGRLQPVFYTSSIEKVTGYPQELFLTDSKLWFKIIYPDDVDLFKRKLRNLIKDTARVSDEFEFRILNLTGNIAWVKNKLKVIRDQAYKTVKIYGLVSDISLSKKAEEELKNSAEVLRELNSTKDKFISIISHDLRTPFSSILGFTDILLGEKDMSESQRTQYIKFIQESSQNMLSLVNSLLDWTRLQTGRIKFEPTRILAGEVVKKSVSIVGGAALQKQIDLKSGIHENLYIHADINLMLQVINNLLSNAIKFTPEKGTITITAGPGNKLNVVQFIIEDTGTGIKKENLDKLFKVDSKFTLEGTSGEKGSGLGLSIVHDIIEKHGGEIWVESVYGKGSKFYFTIPVASADILLVDDSRTDRLLYSKILKSIIPNYKISEANNGREAFDSILKNPPALVITDHHMPEMSGYDLVKKLRVTDMQSKPPVIILSGDVNKNIMEEYRELGIEYVFQKPVNLSSFKEAIEKSLRKALTN